MIVKPPVAGFESYRFAFIRFAGSPVMRGDLAP